MAASPQPETLPPSVAHSVGVAMLGGNPKRPRKQHDFYATPPDVFLAVYPRLGLKGRVHEFCCGDGAICRLLEERGHEVVATDLHDRGYGVAGVDALRMDELMADELVSNPPFNIAPRLIERIMRLQPRVFALLLKSTFWHAKTRIPLFRKYPPSAKYDLSWRPDFEKLDRPTLEMSWVVWDRDHVGPPVYDVLERPPGFAEIERAERAERRREKLRLAAEAGEPVAARPRSRKGKARLVVVAGGDAPAGGPAVAAA